MAALRGSRRALGSGAIGLLIVVAAACNFRLDAGSNQVRTTVPEPAEAGIPAATVTAEASAPSAPQPPFPSQNDASVVPTAAPPFEAGAIVETGTDATGPSNGLPVGPGSPVVLVNDGARDNFQGEYALALANAGVIQLREIVVNTSQTYPNIATNTTDWNAMIAAARNSGLTVEASATASATVVLVRPESGNIADTVPNESEGARAILRAADAWGSEANPIAVVTGGVLTDVADAYLMDPTLPERAVVVASLGNTDGENAQMRIPNGQDDAWACVIVVEHFRYVQVNGYYAQREELDEGRLGSAPNHPFSAWLRNKQASILPQSFAADQVGVMNLAFPEVPLEIRRLTPEGRPVPGQTPTLIPMKNGRVWHVRASDWQYASSRFWRELGVGTDAGP